VGTDTFISGVSQVRGSSFGDIITGDSNSNTLDGQAGNDVLDGAAGNDTLTGGTGSDIFVYGQNSNFDRIQDFSGYDGEADRIDLRAFPGISSINNLVFQTGTAISGGFTVGAGPDIIITGFGPNANLQLVGAATHSFTASDFIFNGQVAITVQTTDGYNFGTLYDDMAGSIGAVAVVDGSHFTATNSAHDLVFSMTVSGDTAPGNPLTGTVNAIDIYDLAGNILANTNGWNFLASDLNSALTAYANNPAQTSSLDSIFGTVSYSAVGNFMPTSEFGAFPVNFGADTFLGDAHGSIYNGFTNATGDYNNGDTVDYSHANTPSGVTIDLGISGPQAGAGGDILINIENLRGSSGADHLTGDNNNFGNVLEGGPGNDTLDGGGFGGYDTVSYEHAPGPVTVDLSTTAQQNTISAGLDTLSNFEAVRGSDYADTLTGNGGSTLEGGLGADQLIGQPGGSDIASYQHAATGVTANLANPAANTGDAAGDTYTNIVNLRGSQFNDVLVGNSQNNVLDGGGTHDNGSDVLTGGGGADTFVFSGGGNLTITDFNHGDGDKIDLSYVNFGQGIDAVTLQALIDAAPANAQTLDFGNGQYAQVLTLNVNVDTLQVPDDFILHHP
jgi:Ca2+-binding RTX toxin-like protein